MLSIAHIINPVKVDQSSDLFTGQPITFESMLRAKTVVGNRFEIQLFTTQYPEDHNIIPAEFIKLPDLKRSVLDIASFSVPRKLPLIADIINQLDEYSDAEYFIYTNVDIGLMPDFYIRVAEFIGKGHDAFIINRRRLSTIYTRKDQLEKIYQDKGKPHPGFDCFVFHRSLCPFFRFDHICVGIPFIGVTFAHHLFCFAQNFKLFDKAHLTFHIGAEIMPPRDQEYYWYNRKQFNRIRDEYLWDKFDIQKFPYAKESFLKRYYKWARNPSLFVFMNFRLELRKCKKT